MHHTLTINVTNMILDLETNVALFLEFFFFTLTTRILKST